MPEILAEIKLGELQIVKGSRGVRLVYLQKYPADVIGQRPQLFDFAKRNRDPVIARVQ